MEDEVWRQLNTPRGASKPTNVYGLDDFRFHDDHAAGAPTGQTIGRSVTFWITATDHCLRSAASSRLYEGVRAFLPVRLAE